MLKIDEDEDQEKNTLDYSESEEDDDEDMENIRDLKVSDKEEVENDGQNPTE